MDDDKQSNEPQNNTDDQNGPTTPTEQTDASSYVGEKEEFVTESGEPTVLEAPAEAPAPMVVTKKKSSAGKWLLWGLVVLLLAGLGALAYWQWTEADNARKELSSVQSELKTVKANANNTANKEATDADEPAADTPDSDELAKTEVEALLKAAKDNKYVYDEANVKQDENFVVASAIIPNSDAPRQVVVLKKSQDMWVVVYNQSGPVSADDKADLTAVYGVPAKLLE